MQPGVTTDPGGVRSDRANTAAMTRMTARRRPCNEITVAWEGDRVSGTVKLAPAGRFTRSEIPAPGPPVHDPGPPTPTPDPTPDPPGPPAPGPTPVPDPAPPVPEPDPTPPPQIAAPRR